MSRSRVTRHGSVRSTVRRQTLIPRAANQAPWLPPSALSAAPSPPTKAKPSASAPTAKSGDPHEGSRSRRVLAGDGCGCAARDRLSSQPLVGPPVLHLASDRADPALALRAARRAEVERDGTAPHLTAMGVGLEQGSRGQSAARPDACGWPPPTPPLLRLCCRLHLKYVVAPVNIRPLHPLDQRHVTERHCRAGLGRRVCKAERQRGTQLRARDARTCTSCLSALGWASGAYN